MIAILGGTRNWGAAWRHAGPLQAMLWSSAPATRVGPHKPPRWSANAPRTTAERPWRSPGRPTQMQQQPAKWQCSQHRLPAMSDPG